SVASMNNKASIMLRQAACLRRPRRETQAIARQTSERHDQTEIDYLTADVVLDLEIMLVYRQQLYAVIEVVRNQGPKAKIERPVGFLAHVVDAISVVPQISLQVRAQTKRPVVVQRFRGREIGHQGLGRLVIILGTAGHIRLGGLQRNTHIDLGAEIP